MHVNNGGKTKADILHGYRSALYFGIGLAAFGLLLAFVFLLKGYWYDHKATQQAEEKDDIEDQRL